MKRRDFTKLAGVATLAAFAAPALIRRTAAQGVAPKVERGTYLINNGAVITVDPSKGTLPRADVLVRDGVIERVGTGITAPGAEVIDAADMIVMPGFVDTHYHMWSAVGRSFTARKEGFSYFPAKFATSALYTPEDFYASVLLASVELANAGTTTVHNWDHNTRTPAHADAELRAHRDGLLRARYAYGHIDRLPPDQVNTYADIPRVQKEWFGEGSPLNGLVHLGLNLRGTIQSDEATFHKEMEFVKKSGLPVAIHASQEAPNVCDAVDYEKRGYLGPKFLIAHYIPARVEDLEAMARTNTPLAFSTHSELRLSGTGDARAALLRMRAARVNVSLSSDATSIAPPDMFEMMRFTWNLGVPWKGTENEGENPVGVHEVIEMATINGAKALGLGEVTGSLTEGKRADIILIRTKDVNVAPVGNIETAVVQTVTPANVDTVIVDGRILKRSGRLIPYDMPRIIDQAEKSASGIRKQAGDLLKF